MPVQNLFGNGFGAQPMSIADYDQQALIAATRQQALAQNALALMGARQKQQEYLQGVQDQRSVRNALLQLGGGATDQQRIEALKNTGLPLGFSQADALEKSMLDRQKTQATISKDGAETTSKALGTARDALSLVRSPQDMATWIDGLASNPATSSVVQQLGGADAAKARIPTDPRQFATYLQQNAVGMEKFMANQTTIRGQDLTAATSRANNADTNATSRANNAATNATTQRGQNMTDARARETNDIDREGKRTQIITDPNLGVVAVDKGTGTFRPVTGAGGAVIPGEAKVAAGKLQSQLGEGIKMARELIPKATASGAGALADAAAGMVGISTPGGDAASQLDTLSGWMTSNVPRMQGPQSDKDVMLYKQMAAAVGDRTKPASARLKALDTLEQLQSKYAEINGSAGSTGSTQPARSKSVTWADLK